MVDSDSVLCTDAMSSEQSLEDHQAPITDTNERHDPDPSDFNDVPPSPQPVRHTEFGLQGDIGLGQLEEEHARNAPYRVCNHV